MRVPIISMVILGVLMIGGHAALAQVTIFTDPIQFELVTGAEIVPIPDAATAFPGVTCGLPLTGRGPSVVMVFDTNTLTVTKSNLWNLRLDTDAVVKSKTALRDHKELIIG